LQILRRAAAKITAINIFFPAINPVLTQNFNQVMVTFAIGAQMQSMAELLNM
jgi:hypothetical protein